MADDGFRDVEIDPIVIVQARQVGLIGNVERRVRRMAKYSAPITHQEGNRRYESFILRIEKGVVKSLRRFDPQTGEIIFDVLSEVEERNRVLRAVEKHLGKPAEAVALEPELRAIRRKPRSRRREKKHLANPRE
jgi:hypothetical protein